MPRLHPVLTVLLLAMVSLAGCAEQPADKAPPAASVLTARAAPNTGILLRVLVITDEYFPVPDAKVTLVGLGVNGTTDDWGDAFFHVAKPGRYALHVHRAGFYPNQTKVLLDEANPESVVRVWLRDAPHDADYADFYYYAGLCGPTIHLQAAGGDGGCTETPFFPKPQARFLLGRGLVHAFIELEWKEHAGGAKTMRVEARFPDIGEFANGRDALLVEGPSPLRLEIPDELLTPRHRENGNAIHLRVGLGQDALVAHNVEQEFQIQAVFDYHIAAPDVDPDH